MGRHIRNGFDYFPLDTSFDDNTKLLLAECGHVGLSVLIQLWQKIYRNSYYIDWNDDTALLFAREINSELIAVNSVINVCFKRNIFSFDLFERHGILTSHAIQKRYTEICKAAKRLNQSIESSYNLCENTQKVTKKAINSEEIAINSEEIAINSELSTRSWEKVSKSKKSSAEVKRFTPPSLDQIRSFIEEKNLTVNPETFFTYYESNGWMIGKAKMKKWEAAVSNWNSRSTSVTKTEKNSQVLTNQIYKKGLW